ncbi:hypothetical protein MSG28_016165 [Choristoneura fumiferana]|uniref:Uncharacterized protein n=1 Tax=Choristoneura fumiferana TaxID=7141 RepID=A0ACC0K5G3_CHOFU|nr:hypothetical protein MSG28_016165 [Choristoneura fumiferana]
MLESKIHELPNLRKPGYSSFLGLKVIPPGLLAISRPSMTAWISASDGRYLTNKKQVERIL